MTQKEKVLKEKGYAHCGSFATMDGAKGYAQQMRSYGRRVQIVTESRNGIESYSVFVRIEA